MPDKETTWKRARSPEQVAQRRESILDAANQLLEEGGLDAAGLNAIARQVGLSKPNLYRYFESREAILLQLLIRKMLAWGKALDTELHRLAADTPPDLETVAHRLASILAEQHHLGLLFHALPSIIEHNISLETATAFKAQVHEQLQHLADALAQLLPDLNADEALRFLWLWGIAGCGAWPHCNPHPVTRQAMQANHMDHLMQPYPQTIEAFAIPLLREALERSRVNNG